MMKPMKYDKQLLSYLLLLRYGSETPSNLLKPILNYYSIVKIIKKPLTTVIRLIKEALVYAKYGYPDQRPSRSKLLPHHISYLVSSSTL